MYHFESLLVFFFFNDTATTEIYTLSLHDALPISAVTWVFATVALEYCVPFPPRSEEHTSELQSRRDLVCRLLLEKKKNIKYTVFIIKIKLKRVISSIDTGES